MRLQMFRHHQKIEGARTARRPVVVFKTCDENLKRPTFVAREKIWHISLPVDLAEVALGTQIVMSWVIRR